MRQRLDGRQVPSRSLTHAELARAILAVCAVAAMSDQRHHGCAVVLLQSGRKDPRVHRFHERRGFEAGLWLGYVAHPVTGWP